MIVFTTYPYPSESWGSWDYRLGHRGDVAGLQMIPHLLNLLIVNPPLRLHYDMEVRVTIFLQFQPCRIPASYQSLVTKCFDQT